MFGFEKLPHRSQQGNENGRRLFPSALAFSFNILEGKRAFSTSRIVGIFNKYILHLQ